ncbi:hypothetical protein [Risungbinella massiliensis]|uniref:hypothetical protein n=1 Tax=Risungbinella massiliensis TaxID=1329796 RepID=UPI0005CC68C6|nr:hypothetical protein [Risungbinella massiliensis]
MLNKYKGVIIISIFLYLGFAVYLAFTVYVLVSVFKKIQLRSNILLRYCIALFIPLLAIIYLELGYETDFLIDIIQGLLLLLTLPYLIALPFLLFRQYKSHGKTTFIAPIALSILLYLLTPAPYFLAKWEVHRTEELRKEVVTILMKNKKVADLVIHTKNSPEKSIEQSFRVHLPEKYRHLSSSGMVDVSPNQIRFEQLGAGIFLFEYYIYRYDGSSPMNHYHKLQKTDDHWFYAEIQD